MAFETLICEDSYYADGTTNPRAIGFPVADPNYLTVEVDGVEQTLGIDYIVDGDYAAGDGRIVPLIEWADGAAVDYYRITRLAQGASIPAGKPLPSRSLEAQLDRDVMRIQEIGVGLSRAPQLPRRGSPAGKFAVVLPGDRWGFASGTGEDGALREDLAAETGWQMVGADGVGLDQKIGDLEDNSYPGDQAAIGLPYYNFRTQRRNLADFIQKEQWASCRAGVPTQVASNGYGVDAFSAALSDMAGAVGGEIEIPDGYFRLPQILINQSNLTLRGRGRSSVIQTTSASAHQIDVNTPLATIADLDFSSTVARIAGACIRVRPTGSRFHAEGLVARNAFTLLHIGDITSDSEGGVFTARRLRAEDTVTNGYAYVVEGGYLVNLEDIIQIGNPLVSALTGPASGMRVLRCADLRIGGSSQFINCQRSLDVYPPTGKVVASLRMEGGFCGTSYYGSRVSGGDGGSIVSFQAKGTWFGENLYAGGGATGIGSALSLAGAAAGRFKQAILEGCEFPLAQFNGLDVDAYVRGLQVIGGWADGCGGAGYAFNNTQDFLLMGVRSGAQRWAGNNQPYYIGAAADYFRILGNDFRDNAVAGTNGAGTSATKLFQNNL